MAIQIAQDPAADKVLSENPFALLCGMLLDQQFPMERAFAGPAKVLDRFGSLDPVEVAGADPEQFAELCSTPPAVHRFPGSMAARIQALAAHIVTEYDGHTERLWTEASTGRELFTRLQALPGFGKQKSQIFVALLAKQLGVRPDGWADAAGDYSEPGGFRSVADVVDARSLERVRAFKKEKKAAAKKSDSAGRVGNQPERVTMRVRLLTCTGLAAPHNRNREVVRVLEHVPQAPRRSTCTSRGHCLG